MAKPFDELREHLLRAGVAPRHVRRYLAELGDHLADLRAEEERAGRNRTEAESAALVRLGGMDDLARAMIEQRQFRAWCVRAPWAAFGLAPLLFLAAAYLAACAYLWCMWTIFLPGADTPFGGLPHGPVYGIENLCMQAGKYYYLGIPFVAGWGVALVAARQRLTALWPAAGLLLVAWFGATAQIHASRTAVPDGLGHITMSFAVQPSAIPGNLIDALIIFLVTAMPYLVWRLQRARSLTA